VINVSWAAGFFDGEGSVSILLVNRKNKPNTSEVRVVIQVTQQQPEPLELFKVAFGGTITPYGNGQGTKLYYKWLLTGKEKTRNFLTTLLPFLVVKRSQAEKALDCISLQHPLGALPYSEAEKLQFQILKKDMQALNAAS
jgi:hypothetical protein